MALALVSARGQKISVNAGFGMSNLLTSKKGLLPDYQLRPSFSFDISNGFSISSNSFISTGIGFSKISSEYEDPLDLVGYDENDILNLFYIRVPIQYTIVIKKVAPFIGPSIGYRINQNVKSHYQYHYEHVYGPKFSFGVDLGLRYKLTQRFSTGVGMHYGMTRVDDVSIGGSHILNIELNVNYIFFDKTK